MLFQQNYIYLLCSYSLCCNQCCKQPRLRYFFVCSISHCINGVYRQMAHAPCWQLCCSLPCKRNKTLFFFPPSPFFFFFFLFSFFFFFSSFFFFFFTQPAPLWTPGTTVYSLKKAKADGRTLMMEFIFLSRILLDKVGLGWW